jgi:hypothetical protein
VDLEEAMCVKPGDKLIFNPQDKKELTIISSINEQSKLDLFVEQPVIVSSVVACKETPIFKSKKKELFFLEQLIYKTDNFKDKYSINQINFEIEESMNILPMRHFTNPNDLKYFVPFSNENFKELREISMFQKLNDIINTMELGDFLLCDYMDSLVDENIHDLNFRDYINYLYFASDFVAPSTFEEIEKDKQDTIDSVESQMNEGLFDEEDLERVEEMDVAEVYKSQFELNIVYRNFYLKSANFCKGILNIEKGIKTYADFASVLSKGLIKDSTMNFFLENGYLLKKEFLRYAGTGYDSVRKRFTKRT